LDIRHTPLALRHHVNRDESPAAPAPAPGPAQVSVGQSIDEVIAALGQPTDVLKNGNKQIYVYKDFKVTFKNGKVSDVR